MLLHLALTRLFNVILYILLIPQVLTKNVFSPILANKLFEEMTTVTTSI